MLAMKKQKIFKIVISMAVVAVVIILSKIMYTKYAEEQSATMQLIQIVDNDEEENLSKDKIDNYKIEINKELEEALSTSKDKFNIKSSYYSLGVIEYLNEEYDKSIEYLKEALKYNDLMKTSEGMPELDIKIYSALSSNYLQQRKIDESNNSFNQAKSIALKINKKYLLCELYYGRAKAKVRAGYHIDESIDLMRKALEYTDVDGHRVRNYLYLSTLYKLSRKFDLAFEYTLNGLEIAMNLNDDLLINKCIINLGENYYIQKNYSKTIEIYEGFIESGRLKDINNILTLYGYLAECYAKNNDYINYIAYRERYLEIVNEINSARDFVWIYLMSAEVEIDYKNIELAQVYFTKAEEIYFTNHNDMYINTDILLKYVERKMNYLEYGDYEVTIESYDDLLKELANRGIEADLIESILNEALKLSYEKEDYDRFISYLKEYKNYKGFESSQAYTDSIFTGVNDMVKKKEILRIKSGIAILSVAIILSIYGLISSRRKNKRIQLLNEELKVLNSTDSLTKVYNKGYLNEKLKKAYENNEYITLVMIDIDCFKLYNDNYGHIAGDKTLIEVAETIKQVFHDDMVFRYGGEEFTIISYKSSNEIVKDLESLRTELYNKNITHKYSLVSDRVTLSIGVSAGMIGTESKLIEIMKKADENLYKSKQRGRNRYTCEI